MSLMYGPRQMGKINSQGRIVQSKAGVSTLRPGDLVDVYEQGQLIAKNAIVDHLPLTSKGVLDGRQPITLRMEIGPKESYFIVAK